MPEGDIFFSSVATFKLSLLLKYPNWTWSNGHTHAQKWNLPPPPARVLSQFFQIYVYECLVCMYVYIPRVPNACGGQRGHGIPKKCSYGWLWATRWVLELNVLCLLWAQLFSPEPALQLLTSFICLFFETGTLCVIAMALIFILYCI